MPTPAPDSQDWILAVLAGLGVSAPAAQTITAYQLWAASEGMPSWAYNWLATTKGGFGGTTINSAGVYAYPSFARGVAATVSTIRQPNMRAIYDATRLGGLMLAIYQAINGSPWCGGCQGGRYPVALADYIHANTNAASTAPRQLAATPPPWDWSGHVNASATRLQAHCRTCVNATRALRGL